MVKCLHPLVFDAITGGSVKDAIMHTEGAAGVSQLDDRAWRKMACSFKESSTILCNSIALVARKLATQCVDPKGIEALVANRGIALDKCPGLRPIGVGEILRRIIGKAILGPIGCDVQKACGPLQLCAGQSAGVEATVHAMRALFESDGVFSNRR